MIKTAAILLALAVVGFGLEGVAVKPSDSSFVVKINRNYFLFLKHLCNGALIDPQWVVAPAQCISSYSMFNFYAISVGSKVFKTDKVIVHEDYSKLVHDIALIRLSTKATLQETGAYPIKIPAPYVIYSGDATFYKSGKSGEIEPSIVSINDLSACSHAGNVWEGHICAGDKSSTATAVKGDEGSPLVVSGGQGETLIGILSYAKSEPAPAVYTRISFYSPWIFVKQVLGSQ